MNTRSPAKGDNGGYGHLRSIGPSLLVYALATQDAVRGPVAPRTGALPQHFSTVLYINGTAMYRELG